MRSLYLRNWIVYSLLVGVCAIQQFAAAAKAPAAESEDAVVAPSPSPERSSVSLSPAVAVVQCKVGQSYTRC
jgi:precorrin-2 methylase